MQDFNAMKSESKQMNRMKAVVLLLALACVNGYAQENNSSKVKMVLLLKKKAIVM